MKQSSWLCKLNKELGSEECKRQIRSGNVSVCTLFWSTVRALISSVLLLGVIVVFVTSIGLALGALLSPIMLLTGVYSDWFDMVFLYGLCWSILVLATILGVIAATVGDIAVIPKWMEYSSGGVSKPTRDTTTSKFNLLLEYIKAKKDKVCPIIKVTKD